MITNARVLQAEFIPQEVEHRDPEVRHLTTTLDPLLEEKPAETAFLFGPSGTGKTCISHFTLNRLEENIIDINTQYVNCWEDYTRFKTLYRILDGINQTLDIHRQSTPKDELLERLREYEGPSYVVILDEVDQLEDTGVLYDLYRIPGITMILIANREQELFVQLDERVRSRLQNCTRIQFDKYSIDELVSILRDRARWGLTENAVNTEGLRKIGDAAAGDARVAIGILRSAARTAEKENQETISEQLIEKSIPEAESEITRQTKDRLTPHQQVLYEIVLDAEKIDPGDLYSRYEQQVENAKTKRMIRNHLSKMRHYNLIAAEGATRGRTYRVVR